MKKYINSMILLSATGVIISGILLYQHYFPELELGFISCGNGFSNPCITVGQSKYSMLFGVPVAAYGLLYFIFITFLVLIADYASDKYYKILCGVIFPLVIAGLAADLLLAVLMIKIGEICKLCVATYVINILLFIISYRFIKTHFLRKEITDSVKGFLKPSEPDGRASLSLSILLVFFLSFAVFSGTNIIRQKSSGREKYTDNQKAKQLTSFYNQTQEKFVYPASSMTIGDNSAKLKIYIFNDFLCSACYKLYQIEKQIVAKYRNSIQIVYYHYPLDSTCNRDVKDTVYQNSCLASRSMAAAAEGGFFEEYFYVHFSGYSSYKDGFGMETINGNLLKAEREFKIQPSRKQSFETMITDEAVRHQITEHIEFAIKAKIDATPTLIISGRKIQGVPPKELLESIIDTELSK